jgi:hypothetical protein
LKTAAEPSPVVFVVDDDAYVRDGLKSLLRSVNLQVETFGSASEFLQTKLPDAPVAWFSEQLLEMLSGSGRAALPKRLLRAHGLTRHARRAGQWWPREPLAGTGASGRSVDVAR